METESAGEGSGAAKSEENQEAEAAEAAKSIKCDE